MIKSTKVINIKARILNFMLFLLVLEIKIFHFQSNEDLRTLQTLAFGELF